MSHVDLTQLGIVLLSAVLSAFLALYAMSALERRRRRDPSIFEAPATSVVFLFEDDDLVDATAAARQLLSVTPRDGSPWNRLLQALLPRFPSLGEEMSRLVDAGTVSLTSLDGHARLDAEWRQGLARISLTDIERSISEFAVDGHALAALEGELEVLRGITDRVPYLTWKESADGEITWANAAYLDMADQSGPVTPLKPWPPRVLFPRHEPGTDKSQSRVAVRLPGDRHESWFEMMTLDAGDGALRLALPADAMVRAEATQQSFEQPLTKTFANLTVGLVIFDRTRKLALFNPALADLTGLGTEFL
jgi:PAS domain-containing protein